MNKGLKEKIEELVNDNFGSAEYFLVDTIISGSSGRAKITILIDGDLGVTIEKCAEISRKVGNIIEAENIIEENYILEVSSPGVDQPISSLRQFQKNVGRKLKIILTDDSVKIGKLLNANAENLVLEEEAKDQKYKSIKKEVEIPMDKVKKTNILVSFN